MTDEAELIDTPTADVPKLDPSDTDCRAKKSKRAPDGTSLFKGYCRNTPGKGTDHLGEGRCKFHDGQPAGPANPNWKHGLNSTVLREEDTAMLEAIEDMTTAAKLEETLNLQLVKLYRAVNQLEDDDRDEFLTEFWRLAERVDDPDKEELAQLARILNANDRAVREWMDLIRKTAKDLHKITDGETVNVEHDVDAGALEDIKESVERAYGE